MNTFFGNDLWDSIRRRELVDDGPECSFIRWIQTELVWDKPTTDEFIKSVPPSDRIDIWVYLREQAMLYDQKERSIDDRLVSIENFLDRKKAAVGFDEAKESVKNVESAKELDPKNLTLIMRETKSARIAGESAERAQEPVGFDFECDGCRQAGRPFRMRFAHHDRNQAIEMARYAGWIIRGTGQYGPDDCPDCKKKLEAACGRKIRGDGGWA